jgi:hypothetical protein
MGEWPDLHSTLATITGSVGASSETAIGRIRALAASIKINIPAQPSIERALLIVLSKRQTKREMAPNQHHFPVRR